MEGERWREGEKEGGREGRKVEGWREGRREGGMEGDDERRKEGGREREGQDKLQRHSSVRQTVTPTHAPISA